MQSIDKTTFGPYVARLRKERGLSQRELANMLNISDKAVSKWERSVSLPDVSMLLPLANALGVTVTDLLRSGQTVTSPRKEKEKRDIRIPLLVYLITIIAALGESALVLRCSSTESDSTLLLMECMAAFFAAYFLFFAQRNLPDYYDHNRISHYSDGFLRINVPGIVFNNRNWPHIRRAGAAGCLCLELAYPLVHFLSERFIPEELVPVRTVVLVLTVLGGIFLPLFCAAKKYE